MLINTHRFLEVKIMLNLPIDIDYSGKVVVVTGAGGLICGAMARAFAQSGAKVAALDLKATRQMFWSRNPWRLSIRQCSRILEHVISLSTVPVATIPVQPLITSISMRQKKAVSPSLIWKPAVWTLCLS